MEALHIGDGEALVYSYSPPQSGRPTFVFINALTGSVAHWEHPALGPAVRARGFGTLAWNFRGQDGTTFGSASPLGPRQIVEDLQRVVAHCAPPAPILVGLSIGGLFAAEAIRAGTPASGIVLINTLRKPTLRLDWINRAVATLAAVGGGRLVGEALAPVILNPDQLAASRPTAFGPEPYRPMDPSDGLFRLMAGSLEADWAFDWSLLEAPTLVVTGRHDRLFRVAEDVAELAATIRDVQSVDMADAGHMIPVERPAALAEALITFAERCR